MTHSLRIRRQILLRGVAFPMLIAAGTGLALPAFAQDVPAAAPQTTEAAAAPTNDGDIVVTGSLFRRTDTETPSPLTVLTSENLARAGITTVSDAVRSISADSSGSIPTAFSGGFGAGSSAVSLRGLTVNPLLRSSMACAPLTIRLPMTGSAVSSI